ncbi:MAG TPA: PAS domain-containing protein, partial [Acidobacteriota bacterium]|nr:PAS domain-containing protein [Acidobacteriota bacterium]
APHNFLNDPPFSEMDLISCRNLLIYFDRSLQQAALDIFQYSLNERGFLFLGPAERIVGTQDVFEPVDNILRIFRISARKGERSKMTLSPAEPRGDGKQNQSNIQHSRTGGSSLAQFHKFALEQHGPPSLLVNREYEVIHLSPSAGRFLLHPGGVPTRRIVKLIREELRAELLIALFHAFERRGAYSTPTIRVRLEGSERFVVLVVQPVFSDANPEAALVMFLDAGNADESASISERAFRTPQEAGLQDELQRVRERLLIAVEEFESSKEEMKASNEELRSINEKYESTLEELEASRKELQSLNEELQAINLKLKRKVEELNQANSDLYNLIVSTEINTLFVDRKLCIQRYTPQLGYLFNLVPEDIGRPIETLTGRLGCPEFTTDVRRVLETLEIAEHEIQGTDGRWFLVRSRPYRAIEDKINGVVITFADITERKRTAQELEALNRDLEKRVASRTTELEAKNRELNREVLRRKELQKKSVEARAQQQRILGERIHDGLAQQVSGVRMLAKSFLQRSNRNQQIAPEDIEELLRYLELAEVEVQTLVRGLIPITFDEDAGLVVALERMVERLAELWPNVDYRVEADNSIVIEDDLAALKLYHIAQEAVQNAVKHAHPSKVILRIRAGRDGEIILEVEDNGSGFTVESLRKSKGAGIDMMRHRAEIIDARLEITPRKRRGTLVRCFYRPKDTGRQADMPNSSVEGSKAEES